MARTSPPPSDEAQPLNTCPSRIVGEDTELRNQSFDGPTPPSSPPASTTYYSETSEGQRDADPAFASTDSQHQQQHGTRHQSPECPNQSDNCVQRLWLWESLSIAVATLSLTAIVVTLILQGDRPLPDWPSAITINALIAVFTAIFKACLMMPIAEGIGQLKWVWYQKSRPLRHMEQWDLASRGPWGSLLLISVLRYRNLAVIGAILTILAMAVDPFTQQVVQPYSCLRAIEGERATVPFTNNFTNGGWGRDEQPPLFLQMQSAIYAGLLDRLANTSLALEFECRTGNCTFPSTNDEGTFLSLALESRCTENGSNIAFFTETATVSAPLSPPTISPGIADPIVTVNTTLPGYSLQINRQSAKVMQSGFRTPTDKPSHYLIQVAFLMLSSQGELQDSHAFECGFYPAVNTYSAIITNGLLVEKLLDSQRMDIWPTDDIVEAFFVVNRTIREGNWHECTGTHNPSGENNLPVAYGFPSAGIRPVILMYFPPSVLAHSSINITWWPRDCVYSLPHQTATGLAEAIASLLGGEILSHSLRNGGQLDGSPWFASLFNNSNPTLDMVQAITDGVARAVTARLRQGDGISVNMGPANGTVWGLHSCVRVEWVWLALPCGLLLLTIVFLLLTIVKTRSRQARVWKSSIFAVLFSGLDQQTRQADGPVASLEEMKAAADRATVRLEDTKEGLRLVSQGDWHSTEST